MKNFGIIILFCFLTPFLSKKALAYGDSLSLKTRPFQFSFISPIGTNGLETGRIINLLSINLLVGYAGGLEGLEFGGFANIERFNATGIQIAGFSNIVGGPVRGVQGAGFANINKGSVEGMQSAGFLNIANGNAKAVQFAGFANVNNGSMKGSQFSGFINLVNGLAQGTQVSGFTNLSKSLSGVQLASFLNFVSCTSNGVQLSGVTNVADTVNGIQVAGFINLARRLKGVQIGVINVVDTVERGVAVGIFTFVRHGYNHFEVAFTESLQVLPTVKFGTEKFYNVLSAGYSFKPFSQQNYFGLGYGAGHKFPLAKNSIDLEAVVYQIYEEGQYFEYKNAVYGQLIKLNSTYRANKTKIHWFIGPSINVLHRHDDAHDYLKDFAPYHLLEIKNKNSIIQAWLGVQAGISF